MFDFLKNKSNSTEIVEKNNEENKHDNGSVSIGAGYTATQTANTMTQQAAKTFAKPDTYTGNRTLYDSGAAKVNAKKQLFSGGGK